MTPSRSPAVTAAIDQLKPCPFCGGMARVDDRKGRAAPRYWTGCTRCGLDWGTGNTPEETIAKWNTRPEAQPSPEAERTTATLAQIILGWMPDTDAQTIEAIESDFKGVLGGFAAAVRAQALQQLLDNAHGGGNWRRIAIQLMNGPLPPTQGGE